MSLAVAVVTKGGILVITLPAATLVYLSMKLSLEDAKNTGIVKSQKTPKKFLFLLFFTTVISCYWFVLPAPRPAPFYALSFFLIAYTLLKTKTRARFFPVSPFVSALAFANLFSTAFILFTLFCSGQISARKLLSQKGMHPVVPLFESLTPLSSVFKNSKPRFAFEGCEKNILYAGARGTHGLYKLDMAKNALLDATNAPRAGDTVFLDCKEKALYFPDNTSNAILVFSTKNLKEPVFSYTLSGGWQSMWVSVPPDGDFILAVDDTSALYVFKKMGKLPVFKQIISGMSLSYPVFQDSERVLVSSKKGILSYNFKKNTFKSLLPWNLYHEMNLKLAYDKETRTVYGISDISGWLYAFRLKNKKLHKKIRLGPFIRYNAYDEKNKLLFLADHVFGALYVVDAQTLRVLDKRFIGPRSHALTLSRDGNRLYFASIAGIFYLDLRPYEK